MSSHLEPAYHDWVAEQHRAGSPVTSAATVVILRDHAGHLEVLMLRRGAEAAFAGGLWVFPGGKIDEGDHGEVPDLLAAARNAAVRESAEEASQTIDVDSLVWFAHWVPPQGPSSGSRRSSSPVERCTKTSRSIRSRSRITRGYGPKSRCHGTAPKRSSSRRRHS